jgi:hypothetical protein
MRTLRRTVRDAGAEVSGLREAEPLPPHDPPMSSFLSERQALHSCDVEREVDILAAAPRNDGYLVRSSSCAADECLRACRDQGESALVETVRLAGRVCDPDLRYWKAQTHSPWFGRLGVSREMRSVWSLTRIIWHRCPRPDCMPAACVLGLPRRVPSPDMTSGDSPMRRGVTASEGRHANLTRPRKCRDTTGGLPKGRVSTVMRGKNLFKIRYLHRPSCMS